MTIPESESMVEDGVCDSPCSPEEQRRIVTDLNSEAESNLKEGNLYFLISSRWYTSWQIFVGLITEEEHGGEASEVTRPGPIDNHDIIESESRPQLLKKLEEGVDYALVPLEVWSKLFEWYKGGPPIKRKMICHKSYSVEVYQLCLNVIDGRDDSCTIITLSKQASISQLYKIVSAVTGVAEKKARIWDYLEKKKRVFLDPSSDKNLEESNLVTDQDILLEIDVSEYEASWSEDEVAGETVRNGKSKLSLFGRNSPKDDGCDSLSASAKDKMRGLVGLLNLGNTCFMNSTLQCLAHTPPIVEYFVQDYSNDINADNPLGTRGELAVAFGELLKTLWSSDQNAVAPQDFKAKLAQFAPQFSGYGQHDSQEMLAFLLDGLHEDLNKVKRKPYIEARDSNGRSDDELAEEAWKYHKARNDSVIVDVCQGQYKSTLVCPDCGKISIAFDPFMYLSLPFPLSNTRSMTVAVFYCNGSCLWKPYTVTVHKNGTYRDLTNALGIACGLNNDERLLLAEVFDHKVINYYEHPLNMLSTIKDNERLVAYRFNTMQKAPGNVKLEILHGEKEKSVFDKDPKLLGTPFVVYVKREPLSGADIDSMVSGLMSPLRRVPVSSTVHSGDENGHVPDEKLESLSPETEIEDKAVADEELSFRLFSTDYGSSSVKPLESDSVVEPGSVTKVLVKWDEKDHEKYDSSYMDDLPEVHKTSLLEKEREEGRSLFSCLEAFLAEEPLGQDDMWYCPACKEHKQANKKLDLWKLPDILVFHLKRFMFNSHLKNKINTFVNFPIHDLDLSKYVKSKDGQTYLYNLYAISNHYGAMGSGHYTAYAKLMEENKWYDFNDRLVTATDESEIKTSAAYVLFYQRVKSESATSSKMDVD